MDRPTWESRFLREVQARTPSQWALRRRLGVAVAALVAAVAVTVIVAGAVAGNPYLAPSGVAMLMLAGLFFLLAQFAGLMEGATTHHQKGGM